MTFTLSLTHTLFTFGEGARCDGNGTGPPTLFASVGRRGRPRVIQSARRFDVVQLDTGLRIRVQYNRCAPRHLPSPPAPAPSHIHRHAKKGWNFYRVELLDERHDAAQHDVRGIITREPTTMVVEGGGINRSGGFGNICVLNTAFAFHLTSTRNRTAKYICLNMNYKHVEFPFGIVPTQNIRCIFFSEIMTS